MATRSQGFRASLSDGVPLVLLAGPTAVGKSEIALELAERLGGEIVSVDSMQVYRGMDIGTAKPSAAQRARVPHHLLDVAEITEAFDAARFVRLARQTVAGIQAGGSVAILSGGTGLYFNAFLQGLGEAPPADPGLRAELDATPLKELLCELRRGDPVTFGRIDRQNRRRVVRALEVLRLTGRPFSQQRADWSGPAAGIAGYRPWLFGLCRAPEDLHRRIALRVDEMFRQGLVGETQRLLSRGLSRNRVALQALGYRQVMEYLDGMRSLTETVALVKTRTRQYAKRQLTWFRRQLPLRWIEIAAGRSPSDLAEEMVAAMRS